MTNPIPFLAFVRANAPWLAATAALTLSSSFGQTFFISIFAGEIRDEFGLSHGDWGGIYTLGTLASAGLMLFAGGLTDRTRVRTIAYVFLAGLAVVCLAMAVVPWVWALVFVIFGLRFCGQGMLSHTASVAVGRWFAQGRGRANAIASMGFLLGEALLPFLFVIVMSMIGWRSSWIIAGTLALLFIPLMRRLLSAERQPQTSVALDQEPGMLARHWTRRDMLSHWLFWFVSLGVIAPSTFGTAYFFHQVHLTELKGWSLASFVALIPLYSATSLGSTFLFGAVADRFGTSRIVPLAMVPGALGFLIVANAGGLWGAAIAFFLFGLMQGANSTIGGTFWPEYYGTQHLGSVRAVATSVMVLGSAIGPGLTGYLIDLGIGYTTQLVWMAIYMLAVATLLAIVLEKARRLLA